MNKTVVQMENAFNPEEVINGLKDIGKKGLNFMLLASIKDAIDHNKDHSKFIEWCIKKSADPNVQEYETGKKYFGKYSNESVNQNALVTG